MSIEERIKNISERWFLLEPLLFMTLMSHEITPNKGLRHQIRSGQGRIEYNFDNDPEQLSDAELEENIRAEAVRILLRHPYRHHGKKDAAYMASNITLNENYKFRYLKYKASEIFGNDESFLNQNFEFYYREILKLPGAEGGSELTEQKSRKAEEEKSVSLNPDFQKAPLVAEEEECSALWQEDDFMDEKIKEIIEWAHTNMQWGILSGDFVQALIAGLKPEIDYRKVLSAFRASVISSSKMLTRFKPSRRYGFEYMGKKNEFTTHLLIAVDVSGSISDHEVRVFYSAINRFFKYGIKTIDVLQFDSVTKPLLTMKKAKKEIKVHGRGGTDFQPVIHYFERAKKRYDGLLIFTDGYAPRPVMRPLTIRKTLWICSNKENYKQHENWMKECGKCCWIKE